ncbi:MAG: carboxypeptidase regulatory-like domain-containing protein [Kofleriaceae bacterium]|nr:carboxypeptidase regulatory-like domain-containing protein [Kofleriaceae bacterium]
MVATKGAILGIARDADSGDPVALATILARREGERTNYARKSSDRGLYQFLQLAPGRYTVMGTFAGQTITAHDVIVVAGESVAIDLSFAFGHPDITVQSYGNGQDGAIVRFRPKNMAPQTARIEGTLTDSSTRGRVVGAAISLMPDGSPLGLQQEVTDDFGQFRFENVPPGTYSLSSSYALAGRGQVELRRSGLIVGDGDGIRVPLWVEVSK